MNIEDVQYIWETSCNLVWSYIDFIYDYLKDTKFFLPLEECMKLH